MRPFNAIAQGGNKFPTNTDFDQFIASLEFLSSQLVNNFEEKLFFVLCHIPVGHPGHIFAEQTYTAEIPMITDIIVFGSPGKPSIDHDPSRNRIPFSYKKGTEDEPEPSSDEDETDDNN